MYLAVIALILATVGIGLSYYKATGPVGPEGPAGPAGPAGEEHQAVYDKYVDETIHLY